MKTNLLVKFLSSLPIILITLYFIPFLGVCLILLRYYVYNGRKKISTPIFIIGVGILILIPKIMYLIFEVAKFDGGSVPYLSDIVNAEVYNVNFINYSKLLICIGVIFLIVSFVLNNIFSKVSSKLSSGIRNYITDTQQKELENAKQNDMEMKIRQEKAKNTSYVKCPNCGSDNLLSEKFGTCKYCRRKIENKNYNV